MNLHLSFLSILRSVSNNHLRPSFHRYIFSRSASIVKEGSRGYRAQFLSQSLIKDSRKPLDLFNFNTKGEAIEWCC